MTHGNPSTYFYQSSIIWTIIRLTFDKFWRDHFSTSPTIAELQVYDCFRGITLFYMFNFISEKPSAWHFTTYVELDQIKSEKLFYMFL